MIVKSFHTKPHGGVRGKVSASPMSIGFVVWEPLMSVENVMSIHRKFVVSGPKWWTDWQTGNAIHRALPLVCQKIRNVNCLKETWYYDNVIFPHFHHAYKEHCAISMVFLWEYKQKHRFSNSFKPEKHTLTRKVTPRAKSFFKIHSVPVLTFTAVIALL